MPLLRIIRASGNPIQYPNTSPWPSLRTLYVGTTRFRLNIGECISISTLFLGALGDELMSLQIITKWIGLNSVV
jgi:hypothetical protein